MNTVQKVVVELIQHELKLLLAYLKDKLQGLSFPVFQLDVNIILLYNLRKKMFAFNKKVSLLYSCG